MNHSVKDIIRRRKSVRTFNGAALRKEDRQKYELSSPVIVGTDLYIAAKVSRVPLSEIA